MTIVDCSNAKTLQSSPGPNPALADGQPFADGRTVW